ncbi:hypothetical protein GOODEAATRI_006409, partial [Goodea atripinnis]
CADEKVEALTDSLQTTLAKWKGRIPMPLPLELYNSSNFIGLFVEEQMAEVLKSFAADFATEAASKADVHVEPHKKQLHVTMAYHFHSSHLPVLEKMAKSIDVAAGCDWLALLLSRDIRFANHEVMYPYVPQNDDELELLQGDFIFMSPVEQSTASEGWVYGTSLGTGLSGLLPENYVREALLESHTTIDFVYCSPSLRCIQTAQHILQGLQQEAKTKIRVEPGLFEWTKWVSGTCLPAWIPPAELVAANLSVDTTYRKHGPDCSSCFLPGGLHSPNARPQPPKLQGLCPSCPKGQFCFVSHVTFIPLLHPPAVPVCSPLITCTSVLFCLQIPYLGFCACEEMGEIGVWQLVDPPILPLTHGPNHSFNWREMLMQD